MSSISSGVGLVSGLPINDIVDSLIAVQRRPITIMQSRLQELTQRRTALLGLSARLLAIRTSSIRFGDASFFTSSAANSSDESSVLATAGRGAAVGQFTFTVRNLAAAHQVISGGFATADETPVGAGTLTIESAVARVDQSTPLSLLNGGAGVRAGRLRITDQAGNAADVDLTAAATVRDVLDAINTQTSANVRARVEGDRIVLSDTVGGAGSLSVAEIGSGRTAADLGLLGSSASGVITGSDLVFVTQATRLGGLNDGNGIRRRSALADFQVQVSDGSTFDVDLSERLADATPLSILNSGTGVPAGSIRVTNRAGTRFDIDLSGATTIGDVKAAIEGAGAGLTVSLAGAGLTITDDSAGEGETAIEEIGDGRTAGALGLVKSSESGTITGDKIYSIQTLGDVLRVINSNPDNNGLVIASLSPGGDGLTLTDLTGTNLSVVALNDSGAAADLGLLNGSPGFEINSRRLVAGLDTVLTRSLNGGSGVNAGVIELRNRAGGVPVQIDLSSAQTLADVVSGINAESSTTSITASVSASGLGIELADQSGGTGSLSITDVSGTLAADLNIAGSVSASVVSSGNLQRQYVSAATSLASLNHGRGVPSGKFRITDSTGASAVVDLTQGNEQTLQDVIDEVNSRPIGVVASINATGDGLLLTDTAGGALALKVVEEAGTTASALGILGEAAAGETTIDGTFESRITISSGDTLTDVLDRLRSSSASADAAVINDGSAGRPFRLSLTSTVSGRAGELAIDVGSTGLSFDTLTLARDATVQFGSSDAGAPLVLTSPTNTLTGVIEGVQLDLVGASNGPVTVTVTRDLGTLVDEMSNFVSAFNAAVSEIDDVTRFDPDTETRAILTGDSTANSIRRRLFALTSHVASDLTPPFDRLSAVGVTLGAGSTLQFDETRFRAAFEQDPAAVQALFTTDETGFGAVIKDELDRLTAEDGVIPSRERSIQDSEDILNGRIDQLETLLSARRERLFAQFNATELALSRLQEQQTALAALSGSLSASPF